MNEPVYSASSSRRPRATTVTMSICFVLASLLVLALPCASVAGGLSDEGIPTETGCDPGDVFVPSGGVLLWAADDGDAFFGCGAGGPPPVCNMMLPNDSNCDLDAVTFDALAHPGPYPPISLSQDDGDPVPIGFLQTNAFEVFNVLPPASPAGMLNEVSLALISNPTGPEPDPLDDDVDAYETDMTALMLPHAPGYFFDFSTDQDQPCGLDSGDIYFANCGAPPSVFCDDVTEIQIPDDCDIDGLHGIQPTTPFPSGFSDPHIGSWGYLFSIDANSGPNCFAAGLDPSDVYYTECSKGTGLPPFPGYALWADDVVDLGMAGCDSPGAATQNSANYCDLDALSTKEVPTLSEWGVVGMALLMLSAVLYLRRRRALV